MFVVFCLVLICLPLGRIRLGGSKAKLEYSRISWSPLSQ
ncbi:BCCT family transporter [Halomonas sp. AOP25-F1-15]